MTTTAWWLAAFGVTLGLSLAAAIIWDVWAVKNRVKTISERFFGEGKLYPVIPGLICLMFGLVVGCLLGHLWFPQYIIQ
jgi:hypothetical protein